MEKTDNEILNELTIQTLNNLSLILIGLNRNAEALSLLNEATEKNLRMFVLECMKCKWAVRPKFSVLKYNDRIVLSLNFKAVYTMFIDTCIWILLLLFV